MKKEKVIVSACLYGIECRYNGKSKFNKNLIEELKEKYDVIPLCPEVLGGLSVPRTSCSLSSDLKRVIENESGRDITEFFVLGAERVLKIAKELNVKKFFLKEKSPSCGVEKVYVFDGKNSKKLVKGMGILTQMLKKEGLEVIGVD